MVRFGISLFLSIIVECIIFVIFGRVVSLFFKVFILIEFEVFVWCRMIFILVNFFSLEIFESFDFEGFEWVMRIMVFVLNFVIYFVILNLKLCIFFMIM